MKDEFSVMDMHDGGFRCLNGHNLFLQTCIYMDL